ncbi:amidase family protein [Tsukamurella sp. 8F]|uniref:amidase n=1 Tax=unclassified Tsukamurella TaxID=2633480 RepID=UPI0023B8FB79|nr:MULTISPECIES: amidase family protein [unclassified Tsukamurella]MDF0530922.1 amidase family protein [Tsukamurella sp. 8J]MDF0588247.1 amidase family protein [Tsukamurella sp. 8F]
MTATSIAAAVRAGDRTATSTTLDALERIASTDPDVGAFRVVRRAAALDEAAAVDARPDRYALPLAGVPIAVKDNVDVAGERISDGLSDAAGAGIGLSEQDHPVVRRLRAAGAIVVGLTRVPELCLWGATDGPDAITRNPARPGRTPGGSSGGSGAAVAAGHVPLAHGNDGLGSLRIPAAACSLVAIKPGTGVVPAQLGPTNWLGMAENGPLATTVADAALGLSVMADRPELAELGDPAGLRIGLGLNRPIPTTVAAASVVGAVRAAAAQLSAHGLPVADVRVPYPANPVPLLARWVAAAAGDADDLIARGADPALLQPRSRRHIALGRVAARRGWVRPGPVADLRSRAERFFADARIDVLVTPTLARGPLPDHRYSARPWLANVLPNVACAPYPGLWNLLGWPAATVPFRGTGVQLVSRPGGEADLLAVAAVLEAAALLPASMSPAD